MLAPSRPQANMECLEYLRQKREGFMLTKRESNCSVASLHTGEEFVSELENSIAYLSAGLLKLEFESGHKRLSELPAVVNRK